MKGQEVFPVHRLNGEVIGEVSGLDDLSKWVNGLTTVKPSNVRIHSSASLPVVNNGPDRKFKKVAEGKFNSSRPVPAAIVEFTSTSLCRSFALVPFDLTDPV